MNASDLCDALRDSLPALFECAVAPRGAIRVRTPLLYPDGGMVDVFVEERGAGYVVTDYGDALGWLRMQSAGGKLSPKQRWMIDDVCLTLGVELDRGQITLRCEDRSALSDAVHRGAQAVLRVSDVWFTFRTRPGESIADEVDDWLRQRPFTYERAIRRSGHSGRDWTVDYEIMSGTHKSLVFLLSTGSRAVARRLSEHVVAGCFDLLQSAEVSQASLISLFDDTADVWQPEDINLVQNVSKTVMWSRPDEFEQALLPA